MTRPPPTLPLQCKHLLYSILYISAHCVHLGVQDLLYKKDRVAHQEMVTSDKDEEDEPIEDSDRTSLVLNDDVAYEVLPNLSINFAPAVASARACVRFYRCSPLNREILQTSMDNYNRSEKLPLKPISLIMDVKTRWNSLPYMVRSLLDVKPGVLILKSLGHAPTSEE